MARKKTYPKLKRAINATLGDRRNKLTDELVELMVQLWAKWDEHRDETAPQKYYLGLSAIKQFTALAKNIGLFDVVDDDKTPNPFEDYLKKRGSLTSKN